MNALDALLDSLPAWIVVGGKGGVGKTTCAAALAMRSAERGASTLLLSTDPAGSLADVLEHVVGSAPTPIADRPNLSAMQLDAMHERAAFLARWRDTLVTIVDRGTYLDRDDVAGLIDAALPGADETMAMLALAGLARDEAWQRIVVDTAPTGHTLRLLELPRTFEALINLLDMMQDKHRFMVHALTHRYRDDEADRLLDTLRAQMRTLRQTLETRARLAVILVSRPEPVVVAETARYVSALDHLRLSLGAVVVNAVPRTRTSEIDAALASLAHTAPDAPHYVVPALMTSGVERDAIRAWGDAVRVSGRRTARGARSRDSHRVRARSSDRGGAGPRTADAGGVPLRPLTIVGGKGGVGKTSVACALGVAAAAKGLRVLVVSTDPAPSVGDALAQPVGEEASPVEGAPGLFAQQLDATAAFGRFRDAYSERVDGLFDALMGRSAELSRDRAIARELLALAPPGIDELYALASLGEALFASRYDAMIVDPAPTGHLLRLLEMPGLALDWSHRLLRLMLKYREAVGLGSAAQELLAFSQRTRALQAALHDPARAALLLVALDAPLVRAETERVVTAVRMRGVDVAGVVWNRVTEPPVPLPSTLPLAQFASAAGEPSPRGVDALRRWSLDWTPLSSNDHG